ncbi:hypothetical protein TNCT_226371 [Trichonephila clavata]|uniref:Uncharacterized protein n=1 Tax=Trichonephila clavata TaxID=2740835 RepID=A0A8X6K5V9_TRICU|nr:hypothetical protein TNCT_226371 [Trichonephila clavata]
MLELISTLSAYTNEFCLWSNVAQITGNMQAHIIKRHNRPHDLERYIQKWTSLVHIIGRLTSNRYAKKVVLNAIWPFVLNILVHYTSRTMIGLVSQ